MRVFLTGATGFVGSHLVADLVAAGHVVVGLSRSDAGAAALRRAGAEVVRGDTSDLDILRRAAAAADGVIHAAFDHDAADLARQSEQDRGVIVALGEALAGSDRPLLVTSGTGLVRRPEGAGPASETDAAMSAADYPRGATEEAADALVAAGGRVMVMRLSQVHDTRRQGRISWHIRLAREKGRVAYVGEGTNRLAAVHVSDTARLYRLALETGRAGARYHAVAEEGIPLRDIAEAIGAGLGVPVERLAPAAAAAYFGPMTALARMDLPASSMLTRRELGWIPTGPSLLADLGAMDYSAAV